MRPFDWRPHLETGEHLIWQGKPFPAMGLIRPTQVEILLGLLGAVGVAALLIGDRALSTPGEGGARPWVFLILLIAALLVTGIPFRAMRMRTRALNRRAYALTDRRAMIADAKDPTLFEAHRLPRRAEPVIEPEPHGLATLHFGPGTPRFTHLKDAKAVANLARIAR